MTVEHDELRGLAHRAALAGCAAIRAAGHPPAVVGYKGFRDLVTDADRRSAAAIVALLDMARPGDGLLCEEIDEERAGATGRRWVVDPLDGTTNYVHGVPHWAISVSCEEHGPTGWCAVAGAVHDGPRGETFTASRDGGAGLNGLALTVSDVCDLEDALIVTELGTNRAVRDRQAAAWARVNPRVRDLRSFGSSALDLCWVAAGRVDGYYEDELACWDWSAGALVAAEAGGVVTALGSGVLAAAPGVHACLLDAVLGDRPR